MAHYSAPGERKSKSTAEADEDRPHLLQSKEEGGGEKKSASAAIKKAIFSISEDCSPAVCKIKIYQRGKGMQVSPQAAVL